MIRIFLTMVLTTHSEVLVNINILTFISLMSDIFVGTRVNIFVHIITDTCSCDKYAIHTKNRIMLKWYTIFYTDTKTCSHSHLPYSVNY